MAAAMQHVGAAMREKFHWVSHNTELYLVLDNAGGHGTNECIDEYMSMLKMSTTLNASTKYLDTHLQMFLI